MQWSVLGRGQFLKFPVRRINRTSCNNATRLSLSNSVSDPRCALRLFLASRSFSATPLRASSESKIADPPASSPTAALPDVPSSPAPSPVIVEPSSIPTDVLSDTANIITPLQFGDLTSLGLISWSPPSFFRLMLEGINVTTGLPWFWTIVIGSIVARGIVVPFALSAVRQNQRLGVISPKLKLLQEQMTLAKEKRDTMMQQKSALQISSLMSTAQVNPMMLVLGQAVTFAVSVSAFVGVQKMVALPVPQLIHSGFSLLPDLTMPMPIPMNLLIGSLIFLQVRNQMSESTLSTPEYMARMNVMSTILPVMSTLAIWGVGTSSAVGLYLLITTAMLSLQSLILRHPAVRQRLGIQAFRDVTFPSPTRLRSDFRSVANELKEWYLRKTRPQPSKRSLRSNVTHRQ
ncbi:60Kd inner membrane protein-domain-containing protein [Armillaria novae-zelandiae]|uniref:60Kd inner membrane protein-domain-containing protein n=1 Tax=Armillaria novae-zelandiae TaxID=153914 RepID=A0AA39P3Z9_9AGAR|nr:60Kd inner membrane protein-domain-containing protein [Armillaria novae-zelandiae]